MAASATDPAGTNDPLTFSYEVFKQNATTAFASGSDVNKTAFSFTPDDDGNYRIVLTVSDGDDELYRWSNEKAFTQAIHDVDLAPGVTSGATLIDPFSADPGTNYTLRGWITAIGASDVVVTAPVEVIAPREPLAISHEP